MKSINNDLTRREALSGIVQTGLGIGITGMALNTVAYGGEPIDKLRSQKVSCDPYTKNINNYIQGSDKALTWLLNQLQKDGSFGPDVKELTGYFKVCYLFSISGRLSEANRLMTHMKNNFMQPDNDFKYSAKLKSKDVDYYEKIWGYANAWITFTAQKLGRFDVSYPAYEYLEKLYNENTGGYISNNPNTTGKAIVESLSTTHIGHVSLYLGQLGRAESCGRLIMEFEERQPDISRGMYLRMNEQGKFIKHYPDDEAAYYYLDREKPNQLYFMAGYPIAFLGLLYRVTGKIDYLESAKRYFNFAADCEGVYESHFSHKIAWGAAVLYNISKDQRYADFACRIADLLLKIQGSEGAWFHDKPPFISYDQTAECASWLRQISAEICDA